MEDVANVDDPEIEVTPEMIEAGVRAADLIGFRWGWDSEETVVLRAYLAMDAARHARL